MSTEKNLLSICCLGYNHANFLKEALDSIVAINYPNIEVIVVDDGSTDNSISLLNNIKKTFPYKIEIIAQQNTGNIGKNFNNAWRMARGELISFISLDDVFRADIVSQEVDKMNAQANLAFIASTNAVAIDNNGYIQDGFMNPPTANLDNLDIKDLLEFEYSDFGAFYLQGSIFRKSIIDKVGCFDEDMTGDDIVLRTKVFRYLQNESRWDFELIHTNNIFYRMHANNIHKNSIRQIKVVTEYLEKYWPDREDPEILINWACHIIKNNTIERYAPMFTLNPRSSKLILNSKVQDCILQSTDEKKISAIQYLFQKKKAGDLQRQIILLNSFKINYTKKAKSVTQTQPDPIHYLEYS